MAEEAAEKYLTDVILKPDAFVGLKNLLLFSVLSLNQQGLRSTQDDIHNIFSAACEAMPLRYSSSNSNADTAPGEVVTSFAAPRVLLFFACFRRRVNAGQEKFLVSLSSRDRAGHRLEIGKAQCGSARPYFC